MTKITELYTQTMICKNVECMARIRVGRMLYLPTTRRGVLEYCPLCGNKASASRDEDESYIEVLAEAYGLSVELLQQIMSLWDSNKYQNLSSFIESLKVEALSNKHKNKEEVLI